MDWGPIILVVAIVLAPIAIFGQGLAAAVGLGELLRRDAEDRYEGSELVELNR